MKEAITSCKSSARGAGPGSFGISLADINDAFDFVCLLFMVILFVSFLLLLICVISVFFSLSILIEVCQFINIFREPIYFSLAEVFPSVFCFHLLISVLIYYFLVFALNLFCSSWVKNLEYWLKTFFFP